MNKIVSDRLRDICPVKNISDMSMSEIKEDCNIAFKIIGYNPRNFDRTVEEIYMNEDIEPLWRFIYRVWEADE